MMRYAPLLLMFLMSACSAKIDHAEALRLLDQPEGVIGGFAIGDKWEDIKAKHDSKLKVFDKGDMQELSWDFGRRGLDSLLFTFGVTGGVVRSMRMQFDGGGDNAVTVTRLYKEMLKRFDEKYGKAKCYNADCNYTLADGQRLKVGFIMSPDIKPPGAQLSIDLKR